MDGNKAIKTVFLLPNPEGVSVTPHNFYVDVSWQGVEPSESVDHYGVYLRETDFPDVSGMTPKLDVSGTSAKVAGLKNDVTYFIAVTTVDIYGGEQKAVDTESATTVKDTEGPEIIDVKLDGTPIEEIDSVHDSGTFTLNANDPAGVSRVEFSFDGTLLCTDYNGTPNYSCYWDILSVEDGAHLLEIAAFDTLGNSSTAGYTLAVALDPPPVPIITQPVSGTIVNRPDITVSGSAQKEAEIILYNNGEETGSLAVVDGGGIFSLSLTLAEEENLIQAEARNRAGAGPRSAEVQVTLDTTIPESPTHLSAQAKAGGVIKLSWRAPSDTSVQGYHLYRAATSFTTTGEAEKVNSDLITATSFEDLTPEDGTYYYRVTTKDTADNESELSGEDSASSDSISPGAVSVEYTPKGPSDQATGRMAPGLVDLLLTVSEPLQSTPFLSITPQGGVPFSVDLTKTSDLQYTGLFVISEKDTVTQEN